VHNESVRSTRLVGVPIVLAGFGGLIEVASVANDASATPDPAGQLDAVSCTGLSYCLAVGTAVAWWNGQRWTVVAKPAAPSGTLQEFMNSVSCPQVDNCVVVGTFESRTTRRTLADQWNGHRWTTLGVGSTTNAELDSVSCPTISWCIAGGGTYSGGVGGHSKAVAGTWQGTDGANWTLTPLPPATGSSATALGAPTCASTTVCAARSSGVDFWNGQSWSMVPTGSYDIGDASCQPGDVASQCQFLGLYASAGKYYSDTVQYNGSSWQLVGAASGSTALAAGNPGAYSCAPATSCFAVGQQSSRSRGGPVTFTEYWNGENWDTVASPSPNPAPRRSHYDAFFAVSCVSADNCTAVGRANDDLLAEHWNGTQWQVGRFS